MSIDIKAPSEILANKSRKVFFLNDISESGGKYSRYPRLFQKSKIFFIIYQVGK